jgi:hypothetical protein
MTINIANVDTTSDTFGQWITKTNIIADAFTNKVVTVNSNTATGNAAISGAFTSANLNVYYINGGNNTVYGNLAISTNTNFAANATFNGYITKLGLGGNVQIDSGNSTYRVLTVNSAAGNTLVASKIYVADIADINVTSFGAVGNGQFLVYSSANSYWYNTNNVYYNANTQSLTVANNITVGNSLVNATFNSTGISIGNSTVNVTINSTSVAISGNTSILKIYNVSGTQVFP